MPFVEHTPPGRSTTCTDREHEPPGAIVLKPGLHRYECPSCRQPTFVLVTKSSA